MAWSPRIRQELYDHCGDFRNTIDSIEARERYVACIYDRLDMYRIMTIAGWHKITLFEVEILNP